MPNVYLIVEQKPKAPDDLARLLKELSGRFRLDSYQCRQRLVGRGLSSLAGGPGETLREISPLLKRSGYRHWLVAPVKPAFAPKRILGLTLDRDRVLFRCRAGNVSFDRGSNILAVFAETSGVLADKSVQQLLSSHAYCGRDNVSHLNPDKVRQTILQGQAVLDLYLLDDSGQVRDAVRVFPGKFSPEGLGSRATLSSRQNLIQVLEAAQEYAGHFHLFTDFGLVNLPGCTLHRDNPDDPDTRRRNLISLTRYGWLMADLTRTRTEQESTAEAPGPMAGELSAARQALDPAAATAFGPEAGEGFGEAAQWHIGAGRRDPEERRSQSSAAPGPALPTPPPARSSAAWSRPALWFGGGSAAALAAATLLDGRTGPIATAALRSGTAPLAAALLLFWSAFYFLRMKRRIENTPTSRIRSVAMGMVEVKGRVLRQYALLSPMSHTPCVYYRLTTYRRDQNDRWRVSRISSSANVPFWLEDASGRVEIDPAGCRVSAGTRQEGGDSQEKWVEEVIVDGTLLYVLGFAAARRAAGPTATERKIEALRRLKRDPRELQRFDSDGDGRISESEWDAARSAVEDDIRRDTLAASGQRRKQEEHIIIGKKKGHPLIISETHSEDRLTARYLSYSIPLFGASVVATGIAVYLFINYLKP